MHYWMLPALLAALLAAPAAFGGTDTSGDSQVAITRPVPPTVPAPAPPLFPSAAFYVATSAAPAPSLCFRSVLELSDGTVVVAGDAGDAAQFQALVRNIPPAEQFVLNVPAASIDNSAGTGRVGFLLHLSHDLSQQLDVESFPAGAVENIRHIKATNTVGTRTGVLYISGALKNTRWSVTNGGYFVARLDNNYVKRGAAPQSLVWARTIDASGDYVDNQPWDVGSDGRVVYVLGEPFGANWCAAARLRADGTDDIVPDWRYHRAVCTAAAVTPNGTRLNPGDTYEGEWTPATGIPGLTPLLSEIVFKSTGRIQLRSWNVADYSALTPDGNGNLKKGKWPMDVFYNAPGDVTNPNKNRYGPGYTGYSLGAAATQRVDAVTIDRRTNAIYFGFSIQSKLPGGNPDFEPAVMAMTSTGALSWWSRLYHELASDNKTTLNSTPDQYIDGLAVDPKSGALVVLARCHGNNTNNYWAGNAVVARPGVGGFQNTFTGTNGNIHISWLGKLALSTGALSCATYVADYDYNLAGTDPGTPYADPNLDGWPSHNAGWPQLNTTRCQNDITVDPQGNVYVLGIGRRPLTTRTAFQKGSHVSTQQGAWSAWVRVFAPDLSTLVYSSLLSGQWSLSTGAGGGNTDLWGVYPTAGGVLVAGRHQADAATGAASGNPIPTANVPTWGTALPSGESAILARLAF